ncbi:olfactory receptor 5AP2-like [Leptodactylus fuscus]|uniref:olfactory receptor 5AP2-like n=1 Tax=Leptodactylus fuscus TaxID=238119 RepID=UPI003F4E4DE1
MKLLHLFAIDKRSANEGQKPKVETKNSTDKNNLTEVTEFFLLGFQGSRHLQLVLFCHLLIIYTLAICGNLLIITLVSSSKILHTPMYFFLTQLSISDIFLTTDVVPNMLHVLLYNGRTISFNDCITQLYFFGATEASECLILTVMSYDRYVAICNPLRYSSIMTSGHCVKLAAMCWITGFSMVSLYVITTSRLNFCGSNVIDHFFCDYVPLLENACSDTFIVEIEVTLLSLPLVIIPSIIIIALYVRIIVTILHIPSNIDRKKAFSTCSSHLIVVCIFYWTIFIVYVFPTRGQTLTVSKILSLLYTVFTPFINPIIYSLRNKDIKKAMSETRRKMLAPLQQSIN